MSSTYISIGLTLTGFAIQIVGVYKMLKHTRRQRRLAGIAITSAGLFVSSLGGVIKAFF